MKKIYINNEKLYKTVVLSLTIFFSVVLIAYVYLLYGINVPTDIKIVLNKEDEFKSSIPITAEFENSSIGVISIDDKVINKKKLNVEINDNFSIKGSKLGKYKADVKAFGVISLKKINVEVVENKKLIVCGIPVGIYVETDGLMVLGTGEVKGLDRREYNPAKNILKAGDYILAINGKKTNSKKEFIDYLQHIKEDDVRLTIRRNEQIINVAVKKIKCSDGTYKIGTWIRNNMQGIGTLTFYDKKNNQFGALGHGINDVDTSKLMEVKKGRIYNAQIINIIKGKVKIPGELVGVINHSKEYEIGNIKNNKSNGIYGGIENGGERNIYNEILKDNLNDVYEVGLSNEVKAGKAYIRTKVDEKIEEYSIKIVKKVNNDRNTNKNFVIRITDNKLLNLTNGIVQGMSGSPILQNGKIIGALTHVYVNDPTKGYGIFVENMLE